MGMTREEAIKRLETHIAYHQSGAWPFNKTDEAMDMAISALREQEKYEILKNSYAQLQDIFDGTYASNMAMGAALRKQQWISVEDRLPDEFVSVLVYMPGESPLPTVHEGFLAREGVWYANHFDREPMEITHWMPLPEPPKEEKV